MLDTPAVVEGSCQGTSPPVFCLVVEFGGPLSPGASSGSFLVTEVTVWFLCRVSPFRSVPHPPALASFFLAIICVCLVPGSLMNDHSISLHSELIASPHPGSLLGS